MSTERALKGQNVSADIQPVRSVLFSLEANKSYIRNLKVLSKERRAQSVNRGLSLSTDEQ